MVKIAVLLFVLAVAAGFADGADAKRLISEAEAATCAVRVRATGGAVCGALRTSYRGATYASFRGIPYARQPVGKLRFLAPQPIEPWDGLFNATYEGPVCPQVDVLYGPMMRPRSMGEDCLRVNVHVPYTSLPDAHVPSKSLPDAHVPSKPLPVLVYVPGGGFQFGSGDGDVNGPEYMIDENVVLVTLNFRLGPFGFLSLNTTSVPGNAGLRDIVAALRWVQNNIRAFGGDPGQVTLMGQSAGASAAHLMSISDATAGLFTKVILMSGTSSSGFFTTKPSYSNYVLTSFLEILNITSTDAEEVFNQLTDLPYETVRDANAQIVETLGLSSFNPVVEQVFEGVTRILDDDPDVLVARGRGSNYPLLVGHTNVECESLRRRLEALDMMTRIEEDATAILPIKLLYSVTDAQAAAELLIDKYLNGTLSLDNYMPCCADSLFIYPALKLAETRASTGGAPVFLYQFSYSSDFTAAKQAFHLNYKGAGHLEDLSYVLRVNSILSGTTLDNNDKTVKDWMTTIVTNFMRYSNPTGPQCKEAWPEVAVPLRYQLINGAEYAVSTLTAEQTAMIDLFDSLYQV